MADYTVKSSGFSSLNKALGAKTPSFSYAWNGDDLLLKTDKFDEKKYLDSKFETLRKRQSVLAIETIAGVFKRVVEQNYNLIFEMHTCRPEKFQLYDTKFNMLIESAFSHEENELNLKLSKENIKNSLQLDDGWMTVGDVNRLMKLTRTNPAEAPDPRKFVPKHRR